jgi:predicted enzyme related to lactoylglutathione lyase
MSNPVGYFEIPVTDMDRAMAFYTAVFGWDLERTTVDGYDMALLPHSDGAPGATGALAKGDVYVPTVNGVILYFGVEDIDAVMARALEAGGSVLYARKAVPGVGFVAEFKDSEGNRIALHQSAEP